MTNQNPFSEAGSGSGEVPYSGAVPSSHDPNSPALGAQSGQPQPGYGGQPPLAQPGQPQPGYGPQPGQPVQQSQPLQQGYGGQSQPGQPGQPQPGQPQPGQPPLQPGRPQPGQPMAQPQQLQQPQPKPKKRKQGRLKKILIILAVVLVILGILAVLGFNYGPEIYKSYQMEQFGKQVDQIQLSVEVEDKNWLAPEYKNGLGEPFEISGAILGASTDRTSVAFEDETGNSGVTVIDIPTQVELLNIPNATSAAYQRNSINPAGSKVPLRIESQDEFSVTFNLVVLDLDTLEMTELANGLPPVPVFLVLSYTDPGDFLIYNYQERVYARIRDHKVVYEDSLGLNNALKDVYITPDRYYFVVSESPEVEEDYHFEPVTEDDNTSSRSAEKGSLVAVDSQSGQRVIEMELNGDQQFILFSDGFGVRNNPGLSSIKFGEDDKLSGTFYDKNGKVISEYDDFPSLLMHPSPIYDRGVLFSGAEVLDKYPTEVRMVDAYDKAGKPLFYSYFWGSGNFVSTHEEMPYTFHDMLGATADGQAIAIFVGDDDNNALIKIFDPSGQEIASTKGEQRPEIQYGIIATKDAYPAVTVYPPK